jgi:hypothetical protein
MAKAACGAGFSEMAEYYQNSPDSDIILLHIKEVRELYRRNIKNSGQIHTMLDLAKNHDILRTL